MMMMDESDDPMNLCDIYNVKVANNPHGPPNVVDYERYQRILSKKESDQFAEPDRRVSARKRQLDHETQLRSELIFQNSSDDNNTTTSHKRVKTSSVSTSAPSFYLANTLHHNNHIRLQF